jgi:hypothetical protein
LTEPAAAVAGAMATAAPDTEVRVLIPGEKLVL